MQLSGGALVCSVGGPGFDPQNRQVSRQEDREGKPTSSHQDLPFLLYDLQALPNLKSRTVGLL